MGITKSLNPMSIKSFLMSPTSITVYSAVIATPIISTILAGRIPISNTVVVFIVLGVIFFILASQFGGIFSAIISGVSIGFFLNAFLSSRIGSRILSSIQNIGGSVTA